MEAHTDKCICSNNCEKCRHFLVVEADTVNMSTSVEDAVFLYLHTLIIGHKPYIMLTTVNNNGEQT